MVVLEVSGARQKIIIADEEKEFLKQELQIILDAGGRYLCGMPNGGNAEDITVLDETKTSRVGAIVGNSAVCLNYIIANRFAKEGFINIKTITDKYL